jgi:hypothetical protein
MERHSNAPDQSPVCAEPVILILQETILRGEELLDRIKAINKVLEERIYQLTGSPVASTLERCVSNAGA